MNTCKQFDAREGMWHNRENEGSAVNADADQ